MYIHFRPTVEAGSNIPGENLVISILKVSVLLLSDWVNQLVLVKVDDFMQVCQIGAQCNEFT